MAAEAVSSYDAANPSRAVEAHLVERARQLYAQRRQRDRVFDGFAENFSEPAWDVLLDLFVAHGEGKAVSASSACLAACVPPTTGLRWVRFLVDTGMLEERVDPADRRRRFVRLSPNAIARMETFLSALDQRVAVGF